MSTSGPGRSESGRVVLDPLGGPPRTGGSSLFRVVSGWTYHKGKEVPSRPGGYGRRRHPGRGSRSPVGPRLPPPPPPRHPLLSFPSHLRPLVLPHPLPPLTGRGGTATGTVSAMEGPSHSVPTLWGGLGTVRGPTRQVDLSIPTPPGRPGCPPTPLPDPFRLPCLLVDWYRSNLGGSWVRNRTSS